ncbi:MAG: response regulator transcription factor [Kiritimatiellae bacterium]|nr:response regulator transcription factor [Kiritimatiellia bacterium]
MRILVIEDDGKICEVVSKGLSQEGHTVDCATTGSEGLALWGANQYDAVVLDRMLPEVGGMEILRQMRQRGDKTPVLILSAMGKLDDRVAGLETGADDYLVKPFALPELQARIRAITRRQLHTEEANKTSLSLAGVTLDLLGRTCVREGKKIELQPREFKLLELLMRNAGYPQTKALILETIWGCGVDPQTNIVDVLVCKLRAKIDTGFADKLIQTMRGVGYVFRADH